MGITIGEFLEIAKKIIEEIVAIIQKYFENQEEAPEEQA